MSDEFWAALIYFTIILPAGIGLWFCMIVWGISFVGDLIQRRKGRKRD